MGRIRGFGRRRGRRLAGIEVVARRSSLTFWRMGLLREEGGMGVWWFEVLRTACGDGALEGMWLVV